jgi:hypothetical protein
MLKSSPILYHTAIHPDALAKADRSSNLPLHLILKNSNACSQPAIAELVVDMIDKYPAGLQHRSSDGCLPLHVECMGQCRSSIVAKCIELYPESLCTEDDNGYLLLHRLLRNTSPSVEDALMMMEMHPRGLEVQQNVGYLHIPLHIECIYQCRSSIISKCIELYTEPLRKVDDGNLQLHRLLRKGSSSVEDALMMIDMYPKGVEVEQNNGNIPLHIECMGKCRLSIISKCIELYPESLRTVDIYGCMPCRSNNIPYNGKEHHRIDIRMP